MCNNFPSGSALPGAGFSTHKRRQDKCGTNIKRYGRSVAASGDGAQRQRNRRPPGGRDMLKTSPEFNRADHRFLHRSTEPIPCVGYSSVASRPHGAGILSRFAPIAIRDDQSVSHAMTSGVILLARLLSVLLLLPVFVDRLASGASAGDYRFAIDHANDVQPA